MSDTSNQRRDRRADRPDEVTDPLLWGLALDVADAHQPDEDGGCRNLLCAGRSWPCVPWTNAQRALRVARAPEDDRRDGARRRSAPESGSGATSGPSADQDPLTGWPTTPVPAGSRRLQPAAGRSRRSRGEASAA